MLLFPSPQWLSKKRDGIQAFSPHDLRDVVKEAGDKAGPMGDLGAEFILALRRRNNKQIGQLVHALGYHPDLSTDVDNIWRKAFFLLATIFLGVGHVQWSLRRTNRNSATWSAAQEFVLALEMDRLISSGLKASEAIKKLARDPSLSRVFPYRPKRREALANAQAKREAALLRHWQFRRAQLGPTLEEVLGATPIKSGFEGLLRKIDSSHLLPAKPREKPKRLSPPDS